MNSFTKPALLLLSLLATTAVFADAGTGDFLGYTLGKDYRVASAETDVTRTNGTLAVKAANPVKPNVIEDVTLIITAQTRTIGYIAGSSWFDTEEQAREFAKDYVNLLHAKYFDWAFGREKMDSNLRINEVNLDRQPYNLRFRLDEEEIDGKPQWRFSMTLGWLPDSKEAQAWNNMVNTQRRAVIEQDRQKMLDSSDLTGL